MQANGYIPSFVLIDVAASYKLIICVRDKILNYAPCMWNGQFVASDVLI